MRAIIIISLLFTAISTYAQTPDEGIVEGSYQFIHSYNADISPQKLKNTDAKGTITEAKVAIMDGYKVTVINYDKTSKIVSYKYWYFKDSDELDSMYLNKIFTMSLDEFRTNTIPLFARYKGASVGVYTVPFRLRGIGKDFDFESSLSLQANMVFGFGSRRKPESWFDASLGLGLTSINLNSINSNVTENRTASAFTISLGAVVKPNSFSNIGLFIGWDYLGANDREVNWIYNKGTWIGLGINISFNEIKTNKSAKEK